MAFKNKRQLNLILVTMAFKSTTDLVTNEKWNLTALNPPTATNNSVYSTMCMLPITDNATQEII